MTYARKSPRYGLTALSELTATVLLISITLIAGAALYGLYFSGQGATSQEVATEAYSAVNSVVNNQGGGFLSNAEVSVTAVSCGSSQGSLVCALTVSNTGTANVAVQADICTVQLGGVQTTGTNIAVSFVAGSVGVQFTCTISGTEPAIGSTASGTIPLNNGALVTWSGTWS